MASRSDWYDTREGIESALAEGRIRHVFEARRAHQGGALREWILLAALYLARDGAMSRLSPGYPNSSHPKLGNVCPVDALSEVYSDITISLIVGDPGIPAEHEKCHGCGRTWTGHASIVDFEHVRSGDDWILMHGRCAVIRHRNEERAYFAALLADAGISAPMAEIENQYWRTSAVPWFRVALPECDLTIGWRKRVISIELDCAGIDVGGLFPDQVTKSPTGIHAWGRDKAVEYLTRIREELRAKPVLSP